MRTRSPISGAATNSAPRIVACVNPVPAYSPLDTMKQGRPAAPNLSVIGIARWKEVSRPSVSHPRSWLRTSSFSGTSAR